MDDVDQATGHNAVFQASALEQQQRNREPDDNATGECIDCDQEILEERRRIKPGCRRCITCQEAYEIHSHWGPL